MRQLDEALSGFSKSLARFQMPQPTCRTVGELRADTNWPWGYASGLYCFVAGGDVVYVGRAIGTSLGSRLWSHLSSLEDPEWAVIAKDPETVVLTYVYGPADAALVAALELHLIEQLHPQFNRRVG
jgi:hypothetical protein